MQDEEAADERLSGLRRRLSAPGATPEDLAAYRDALREHPPPAAPAAAPTPRRSRRRRVAALGPLAAAVLLVVVVAAVRASPDLGPSGPPPVTGRSVAIGSGGGLAAVRAAIRADGPVVPAAVVAAALQGVPGIADARSLSESDLVGRGSGRLAMQDLDEFDAQRRASVLVVCERSARYAWTLTAARSTGSPPVRRTGTGSCGALSAATVALPVGLHRTELEVRAPGVRFFAVLLTTGGPAPRTAAAA